MMRILVADQPVAEPARSLPQAAGNRKEAGA